VLCSNSGNVQQRLQCCTAKAVLQHNSVVQQQQ